MTKIRPKLKFVKFSPTFRHYF